MKYLAASVFLALTLASAAVVHAERFEPFEPAYVRTDYSSAYVTVKTLADEGSASAQFELGRMFENGNGVGKDKRLAVFWYGKAAEQGLSKAQYDLGYMYARGLGVPRDDRQAIDWYRKAAGQGVVKAQYNLGEIYSKGVGVPKDDQQAYFWWLLASAQGFPQAVEKRDLVELKLAPEQRAGAQASARSWIPKAAPLAVQQTR
jgi:TPR repeat protein